MLNSLGLFLESTLGNFKFLLIVESIAFSLKLFLFIILIQKTYSATIAKKFYFLLLSVLLGSLTIDGAWILKLTQLLILPALPYRFIVFFIRMSWIGLIIQYHALGLFIENLLEKKYKLSGRQKIFLAISGCFIFLFFVTAFFYSHKFEIIERPLEFTIMRIVLLYLPCLVLINLFFTMKRLCNSTAPRILKKQLDLLIRAVLIPYLIADFIQYWPSNFFISNWATWVINSYAVLSVSTILLTYAIFYCARKMMGLRFLNIQSHVQAPVQINFIDNFKEVFEQINNTTNLQELIHIIKTLFKDAFSISAGNISLHLRSFNAYKDHVDDEYAAIEKTVEQVLNADTTELTNFIKKSKILIYDELDFTNFYEDNQTIASTIQFLNAINADIFLPIYKQNTIIAYITIERFARPQQFYSNIERDEMIVLANYLSTILNLMQNRNLDTIIAREKEMHDELYNKHQEINQYKESIRSFLRHTKQREIGIIFYKNRHFIFGNRTAKELIGINPNAQEGHTLSRQLRHLARDVDRYKSTQSCFAHDNQGKQLVITAMPNSEHKNVIMLIYYPEVSDILTKQIELLKDPSKWDYLLYLETTESGRLISQLIPGSGEKLLNFKISLLKTALSTKATLLQLPEEDLKPTVELLHHISLRTNLHTLNIQAPERSMELAVKLFGINPIFGMKNQEESLLKKLDKTGTLFIQQIHLLSLETQTYLAELINFGFYRIFKSEQRIPCNVRIICSTNQDLNKLANDGTFSKNLLAALNKTNLKMPSLLTLPEKEFNELTTGYSKQTVTTQEFKNFLELTEKDRQRLISNRPSSLQELKYKVQQLIVKKSKKHQIYEETLFDPAYEVSDPQLIEAARLGKHALKDQNIMAMLCHKFKNQNKIAAFLGVNRSSVNRRLREYNLLFDNDKK